MSWPILQLDENILTRIKSNVPENTSPFEQGGDEEQYRFISFVCDYCRKRKNLELMPNTGVSYFVLIPPEFIREVENIGVGLESLKKNKAYDLSGKLFLCLDSSLNKVRVISFSCIDRSLWDILEENLRQIEKICETRLLHTVVDFSIQTISVYLLKHETSVSGEHEILISFGKEIERFSREKLNQFSDDFHEQETKLPTCGMMIWRNQKNYELTDKAEERIALRFALQLSNLLGKDCVSQETRGAHGRADVIIHAPGMTQGLGPCVLEFKVLRHRYASESEQWLLSGVIQVLDYGKDRNAKSHYLLVYDGRKYREKFPSVMQESSRNDITYLHYEMYNTVDGERKEKLCKGKKTKVKDFD